MSFDKEAIYDQEIEPLMSKIIEVCKNNNIPMVASFCYAVSEDNTEELCTTFIPQGNEWSPKAFNDCRKRLLNNPPLIAITITSKNREVK